MRTARFWCYLIIAVALAGCAQTRDAHLADQNAQKWSAKEAEQNELWSANKGWLLASLPQAGLAANRVTAAFNSYSGSKKLRSAQYQTDDYDKLFAFLSGRLSGYRLARPPESAGHLVLIDGSAAYFFDLIHREFSGVASIEKGLFFAVQDVPLERSDARSFAFVADDQTDATTSWSLYRRNVLEPDRGDQQNPESHIVTRAELDSAGVARQVDLLTPQERGERQLARQGLTWLKKAELKAVQLCGGQGARDASKKGGHGKHGGGRNRPAADSGNSESAAGSASASDTTTSGTSSGATRLNCRTGSGYLVTDDGISAQVAGLRRSGDGNVDPLISSTSKAITGGTMTFRYGGDPVQMSPFSDQSAINLELELKSADGGNKLTLNLRPDTGAGSGTLLVPGDWYTGRDYDISGMQVSRSGFAALFIRAYRDCAIRDSQGACKSIPDLFVGLLNAGMAQDLVSYIGAHYTKGTVPAPQR